VARRSLKKPLLIAALAVLVVVLVVGEVVSRLSHRGIRERAVKASRDQMAPDGVRVRVQVINATNIRGLARRATQVLRDRGFDVVEAATGAQAQLLDSSLVLDRSGHPDWAKRVAAALGGARIESRPDSSRYLDVTVLVGGTWRPPPLPFYP
jgi:hypothetical protein